VRAGVELSFLKEDEQDLLSEILSEDNYKIDLNKAIRLRKETNLTAKKIQEILLSQKPIKKLTNKISISRRAISKYFPPEIKSKEIEETIEKALELYFSQNNADKEN